MAQIQKTTVISGGGGLRVEIAIADKADITTAQNVVTLAVVVPDSENPSLLGLQRDALNRARALIEESIRALAPALSAD